MEVINDLFWNDKMKIVQNTEWFNFSLDSILLANFVRIKKGSKKILDLGTGNAPIPLILSLKTKIDIYGVEKQKEIYDLAIKSVNINSKENQIHIINEDINEFNTEKINDFDIVISNPPFFKVATDSNLNENKIKREARHEISITLENLIKKASECLINEGSFYMVHRTERLSEIVSIMKKYGFEIKELQFIYSKRNSGSNVFLIKGVKNGNSGMKVLEPIIVHNTDGSYSEKVEKYFLGNN